MKITMVRTSLNGRRVWPGVLVAVALLSAACATASGGAGPRPFPLGPGPSAVPPPNPPATRESQAVVRTALGLTGTPYRLGGDQPKSGFDCSGFVRYVFERQHVEMPRTVAEQFQSGRPVAVDQIRAGDLMFFSTTAPGPSHVGIALGPGSLGEFVHAPGAGGTVRVEHFDTGYWRGKLLGVRRVL